MKRIFSFLILFLVILSSCEDNEISIDPNLSGQAYYPLEVGSFKVYNVKVTTYANKVARTEEFQTRERIDEVSTDQSGRTWYRVEVSRRPAPGSDWTVSGVKMISPSSSDLRITENNSTTVHMVYPVKNGKTWIFNPLNSSNSKENYTYAKIGEPFSKGTLTYDNTLTIVQQQTDEGNLLTLDDRFEVLALGIGPVYRSSKNFKYCDDSTGNTCTIGTFEVINGVEREEILVEQGTGT